ncbi:MAG TPA: hypothetical protein PLR43_01470, partial [Syntrophales bacterium]|nr:hypothetical protein [Syntrophales bacterium]
RGCVTMKKVKLYEIAHGRAGDKGEITNISLFPYNGKHYDLLRKQVTARAVKSHFGDLVRGEVVRYDVPSIGGFNFVLHGTRVGGVSSALELDPHGKALSFGLLEMEVEIPEG